MSALQALAIAAGCCGLLWIAIDLTVELLSGNSWPWRLWHAWSILWTAVFFFLLADLGVTLGVRP